MARTVTQEDLDRGEVRNQKVVTFSSDDTPRPGEDTRDKDAVFVGGPLDSTVTDSDRKREAKDKESRQEEAEEQERLERLEEAGIKPEEEESEEETPSKYKTKEEAEKGAREANRKMTEATTKAKKLEVIVAELQKRLDEAAEKAPETTPPGPNPYEAKRQQVAKETMAKIKAVPIPTSPVAPVPPNEDDPNYDRKYAEYEKKFEAYEKEYPSYKKAMDEYNETLWKINTEAQAEIAKSAHDEVKEADRQKEAVASAIDGELAKVELSNGTKLSDIEGIMPLFWAKAGEVPKGLALEDQIKRTVTKCKEFLEAIIGKERKRIQKDKEEKESLQVLGGGVRKTTQRKEPEGPKSFADLRKEVLKERRVYEK